MQIDKLHTHYQVVVVGGGMVGCSFALELTRLLAVDAATPVLVIEALARDSFGSEQTSFDSRSTALSFGSSKFFQRMGLWGELAKFATEIREIHVSDRGHFGSARLSSEQECVAALGYVIENRQLGSVLNQSMDSQTMLEVASPAAIVAIKPIPSGMELLVEMNGSQHSIQANLVVLAEGGKSSICEQLGIATEVKHYQQCAIISNIAFRDAHGHAAYERFTDSGPLAILPLPDFEGEHRGALVWTVSEQDAESYMELPEEQLLALLQQRFGYRLGEITRLGDRACYPLTLTVAKEQVRPGLVLLGNAAHTLHPVAGQGFNLALRDVDVLAQQLVSAIKSGINPGTMQVLQRYVEQQERDQSRTIGFSHYLTRLFSSNRSALVWARKFGLASIDLIPAVKRSFARQAMGIGDK